MGKGVRAKRKLLLEMSAACKGGRNVHELFFPPCLGQGGKKSFEQKLSLSGTAFLSATVHACGKQRKFPLIALQSIGRGSEQLLAATSVQVIFALQEPPREPAANSDQEAERKGKQKPPSHMGAQGQIQPEPSPG